MPELPEVETVRRGLLPRLAGARIARVEQRRAGLRFPFPDNFAGRIENATILSVERRAKYLLLPLSSGETLISHLGMTGSYRFSDKPDPLDARHYAVAGAQKHVHLVLHLAKQAQTFALEYADPRRFGFMDLVADPLVSPHLVKLGPEPLGNQFTAQAFAPCLAGRKTPIKSALLDQANVAGLGNIYVCEALWRAGVAPTRPAAELVQPAGAPSHDLEKLVRAIRDVLEDALEAGGSTLNDFRHTDGELGYFQHQFDVYDREGQSCHRQACSGMVVRLVQSGRSSFYCPICQRK